MRSLPLFSVLAAAIASTATAQNSRVQTPDWLHRPTAGELIGVWPREALRKGMGGKAVINCIVTVVGAVRDCQVASEDPPGSGFGLAAIAVSAQFQFKPATVDGKPVEAKVNIPVNFNASGLSMMRLGSRIAAQTSGGVNLTQVTWTAAPTYAQVSAAYPVKAREAHAGGLVTLNCSFGGQGNLRFCDVAEETPKGMGFGPAAKTLAKGFLGPAKDAGGASVAGDTTQLVMAFTPAMLTGGQPVIGTPTWTHLPEALDLAGGFPAAALAANVKVGHVMLGCEVASEGRLANCAVERESPEGMGFGAAALALSHQFQLSVWTDEGLPTIGGHVNVPIRYEAPPAPAPKS